MPKEILRALTKVVGGIAGVVFLFCPFKTGVEILINVVSLVVALACAVIHHSLSDDEDGNTGFWPQDPMNSPLYRDTDHAGRQANAVEDRKSR